MKRVIPLLLCLTFFSGCFLEEDETQAPTYEALKSLIAQQDMKFFVPGQDDNAFFYVNFYKEQRAREEIVSRLFAQERLSQLRSFNLVSQLASVRDDEEEVELVCSVRASSTRNAEDAPFLRAEYLSGGEITWGNSLQTDEKVPQLETYEYLTNLKTGYLAGRYWTKVSGAGKVPGFRAEWEAPELLSNVEAQETAFSTQDIEVDRQKDLTFTWAAPTLATDNNVIFSIVTTKLNDKTYQLECGQYESKLYKTGEPTVSMVLKPTWLSKIPADSEAWIAVERVYMVSGKIPDSGLKINLQSVRHWRTTSIIK